MKNNTDITIREAQEMVDNWITTIGVRYFSPLTNMAIHSNSKSRGHQSHRGATAKYRKENLAR